MPKVRLLRVSLAALPLMFGACLGSDRDGSTEQASGLSPVQLADIPVPDGMKLRDSLNESHSYEVGTFRVADLHYFGNVPLADVASYLRERMPQHGWRLVTEAVAHESELVFDRRPHRATCRIWNDGSVTRLHVGVRTPE